ncbi:MAG TPA: MFS transporter [Myxococcota bacterium]
MSTPNEGERTLRLLAAVIAAQAAGWAAFEVAPLVVSALMERFALREAAAGALASAELMALAAAMLASAGIMARHSRARLGMAGAAIAVAGHVASGFTTDYLPLLAMRVLAGVGGGIAFAAGSSAAAGAREPDRIFAGAALAGGVGGAALLAGLPYAIVPYGPAGAFATLAVLTALMLPIMGWIPAPVRQRAEDAVGPAPHRGMALRGLAALAFLAVGEGAVWAFAAQIGESTGLSVAGAGRVLALSSLLGQGGSMLAAWLGTRRGRVIPVGLGMLCLIAAVALLVFARSPAAFSAGAGLWGLSFFFVFPYLMGAMAALDSRGRWAVAGGAAEVVGLGVGPVVGGLLVSGANYGSLAWFMIAGGGIAFALLMPVVRFADSGSSGARVTSGSAAPRGAAAKTEVR